MPSPFPGMDPYLEGYLWPDVHSALAHTIRQQLAPQIQPKYVARLEISVIEDQSPAAEIGIMYPDVAPLTIPLPQVRLATVEIRDVAQNILVTSIEILSPVNKGGPHLSQYRQKRQRLRAAHVHLLEIDLLRRGTRIWMHPRIPEVGNVYCTGPGGIWILDRAGTHLGTILTRETTTNMAWGDDDWSTMYFTTRHTLGRVRLNIPGVPVPRGAL